MMINASYSQLSNAVKIALMIVGPAISWLHTGNDLNGVVFSNTTALAVSIIILITLIDKVHSEVNSTLLLINENLETSFEYHGLLDSPKDRFTALEMSEKWPLIIEKVRSDFVALNHLSYEAWSAGRGDELVGSLGVRVSLKGVRARRIFILQDISELQIWENTLKIHAERRIEAKYILLANFESIRSNYSRHDPSMKNVNGFNVIDKVKPGIVIEWNYKDRATEGAILKRGPTVSENYIRLFDAIWNDPRCITHT